MAVYFNSKHLEQRKENSIGNYLGIQDVCKKMEDVKIQAEKL